MSSEGTSRPTRKSGLGVRRIVWSAVVVAGLAAIPAAMAWTVPARGDRPVAANEATTTIEIPEVDCAGCNIEVRKAVKKAGGVIRLGEGQPANRLVIVFEAAAGRPDVYVDALRKAGFAKAHLV